jgi:hypothetical protein
MRILLVNIKILLNYFRDIFFNPYSFLLKFIPSPLKTSFLRAIGTCIEEGGKISGSVKLFEPAWIQVGKKSRLKDISANEKGIFWMDDGLIIQNRIINCPVIMTKDRTWKGTILDRKHITFSFDLEGGVGLSHASPKEWLKRRKDWHCQETAYHILDLVKKYEIPTTWAVCGHLFLESCNGHHEFKERDWRGDWFIDDPNSSSIENNEWYMPDLIRQLKNHPFVEVGYHSFGHFNYALCSPETALQDMIWAHRIRKEWLLPLETFVFPYNAPGHWSLLVNHGGFTSLRGYIGQYYLPYTIDFKDFRFFGTSQHIGPKSHPQAIRRLKKNTWSACNLFTHPEEWVNRDLGPLERCFEAIKQSQVHLEAELLFMGKSQTEDRKILQKDNKNQSGSNRISSPCFELNLS